MRAQTVGGANGVAQCDKSVARTRVALVVQYGYERRTESRGEKYGKSGFLKS